MIASIRFTIPVRMSQSGLDADVLPAPVLLLHPGDHDGQAGHGEGPGLQAEEAEAGGHGCPLMFPAPFNTNRRCDIQCIRKSKINYYWNKIILRSSL